MWKYLKEYFYDKADEILDTGLIVLLLNTLAFTMIISFGIAFKLIS